MVGPQDVEDGAGAVDCVMPIPGARTVRAHATRGDLGPQRSLASALDHASCRLQQDREVTGEQLLPVAAQPQQAVAFRFDLFAVIEHVGHVPGGLGEQGRQPELDRHAGLHVTAATAVEHAALGARGEVARNRHGVDVPGQDHPLRPAEVRPRDQGVPLPLHRQVRQGRQRALDRAGQRLLIPADRGDVDQCRGERGRVTGKIQFHSGSLTAAVRRCDAASRARDRLRRTGFRRLAHGQFPASPRRPED